MGIVYDVEDFSSNQVDYDLPLDMFNDDDIGTSLIELWAQVKAINRQLVDHKTGFDSRSSDWLHRANQAKGFKMLHVDRLRMEAQRRRLPEILPEYAQQIAAQQEFHALKAAEAARIQAAHETRQLPHKMMMEQQREDAERRRAEREAKHRITMEAESIRLQGKAELFLSAATGVLTKEQRQAVWTKARAMFPDHASFQDRDAAQKKEA